MRTRTFQRAAGPVPRVPHSRCIIVGQKDKAVHSDMTHSLYDKTHIRWPESDNPLLWHLYSCAAMPFTGCTVTQIELQDDIGEIMRAFHFVDLLYTCFIFTWGHAAQVQLRELCYRCLAIKCKSVLVLLCYSITWVENQYQNDNKNVVCQNTSLGQYISRSNIALLSTSLIAMLLTWLLLRAHMTQEYRFAHLHYILYDRRPSGQTVRLGLGSVPSGWLAREQAGLQTTARWTMSRNSAWKCKPGGEQHRPWWWWASRVPSSSGWTRTGLRSWRAGWVCSGSPPTSLIQGN